MRQILMAVLTIITIGSLGAVGTYAGFVDTEVSEDNYVQTGTLELQRGDTETGGRNYPSFIDDEAYGEDPLGDSVQNT